MSRYIIQISTFLNPHITIPCFEEWLWVAKAGAEVWLHIGFWGMSQVLVSLLWTDQLQIPHEWFKILFVICSCSQGNKTTLVYNCASNFSICFWKLLVFLSQFLGLIKRLNLYFNRFLEVTLRVWVYLWVFSWFLVDHYICKGVSTCFSVSCAVFGKVIN